nr:PREDICTED: uncharacterized protein LOC105662849 [Megachile rotundata]
MVQELIVRSNGCPGRAVRYVESWLEDRELEIRTVGGGSIEMKMRKGLPQGSVLSPLLYNLYTIGIVEGLREMGVRILQYADDIVIFVEFERRREGKSKIEEAIRRLKENLSKIGLSIAMEKTQIVKFMSNRRRGGLTREEFIVENERIEEAEAAKFLGTWIDRGLDFRKHTDYVVSKLRKRMNIVKSLGGIRKGTGPETILKVFAAMNRMSTPINVMETETGIMDLESRISALAEGYIARKLWNRDEEVVRAIENRIRNSNEEEVGEDEGKCVRSKVSPGCAGTRGNIEGGGEDREGGVDKKERAREKRKKCIRIMNREEEEIKKVVREEEIGEEGRAEDKSVKEKKGNEV